MHRTRGTILCVLKMCKRTTTTVREWMEVNGSEWTNVCYKKPIYYCFAILSGKLSLFYVFVVVVYEHIYTTTNIMNNNISEFIRLSNYPFFLLLLF